MKTTTIIFTYSDSEAGMQKEQFSSLDEIKKYINDFTAKGDSEGIIYENGNPVLSYNSVMGKEITWSSIN